MNDVSCFPSEVVALSQHFQHLGLPRYLVCKILFKKHFSRFFIKQQKKLFKQEKKCQKRLAKQERKQQKKQYKQMRKDAKRGIQQPNVVFVDHVEQPSQVHPHPHPPHHGHHHHHHGHHGHHHGHHGFGPHRGFDRTYIVHSQPIVHPVAVGQPCL